MKLLIGPRGSFDATGFTVRAERRRPTKAARQSGPIPSTLLATSFEPVQVLQLRARADEAEALLKAAGC